MEQAIFPSKPKKPEAPFLIFVRHVKPRIIEKAPDLKYSEVLHRASNEWTKLDFAEKENFINEYNRNFKIYTEKLKEYTNSLTKEQKQLWEQKKKEYEQANNKKVIAWMDEIKTFYRLV